MKLSVITVSYNDLAGLKNTIRSLEQQSWNGFEHVIIDGGSSDGTADYLKELQVPWTLKWVSEKDAGIYDAMNKGLARVQGHFCWFLNAGDLAGGPTNAIELAIQELEKNQKVDLLYGKVDFKSEFGLRSVGRKITAHELETGMHICHQGIIYKTEVLRQFPYSTEYRIISDWLSTKAIFKRSSCCAFLDLTLATYNLDGMSSKNHFKIIQEMLKAEPDPMKKLRILSTKGLRYTSIALFKKIGLYAYFKKIQHTQKHF